MCIQEFPELKSKRWLLLPGRITRWKGHADFIRLVGKLAGDYPNIQGVFVGGGRKGSFEHGKISGGSPWKKKIELSNNEVGDVNF